ncbi:hypothetical protein Leryth_012243, partial [Lithospermum erythrorhizon]
MKMTIETSDSVDHCTIQRLLGTWAFSGSFNLLEEFLKLIYNIIIP